MKFRTIILFIYLLIILSCSKNENKINVEENKIENETKPFIVSIKEFLPTTPDIIKGKEYNNFAEWINNSLIFYSSSYSNEFYTIALFENKNLMFQYRLDSNKKTFFTKVSENDINLIYSYIYSIGKVLKKDIYINGFTENQQRSTLYVNLKNNCKEKLFSVDYSNYIEHFEVVEMKKKFKEVILNKDWILWDKNI